MKRFWKKRWLPLPVLIPLLLYAAAAVWTSTRNVSQLPVLMYHHISEDVATDMVISPARFEAHMAALKEHGWNSVTCLLYTSPSPRDLSTSRMPSSA